MDNTFKILHVIHIVVVIATFLYNTRLFFTAIEVLNERLVLLNDKALETVKELTTPVVICAYYKLLDGYTPMYEHTTVDPHRSKPLISLVLFNLPFHCFQG